MIIQALKNVILLILLFLFIKNTSLCETIVYQTTDLNIQNTGEEIFIDSSEFRNKFVLINLYDIGIDSNEYLYLLSTDYLLKLNKYRELEKYIKITRGQGPGEFQNNPREIHIDKNNNLYFTDGYKLIKFNEDLVFQKNIHIVLSKSNISFDKNGNFYTIHSDFSNKTDKGVEESLCQYDQNGKIGIQYIKYVNDNIYNFQGGMLNIRHMYSTRVIFSMDTNDRLYLMLNTDNKISIVDTKGNRVGSFNIITKKIDISKEEKEAVFKRYVTGTRSSSPINMDIKYTEYRPYIKKMLIDKNVVYLVHNKSILDKSLTYTIDIYDKFKYISQMTISGDPLIIKNGYVYWIDENEEDINFPRYFVKRAKIYSGLD